MPIPVLLSLALTSLGLNSVLLRLAVVDFDADPAVFAVVRVAAGAAVLVVLALRGQGAWPSRRRLFAGAVCLAGYMATFSLGYRSLDAGFGALLLFGWVQITMFTVVTLGGNRPRIQQWIGAIVAFAGLVWPLRPSGLTAGPVDLALMSFGGIFWGGYTLLGRGAGNPVRVNAACFALCLPLVLPLLLVAEGGLPGPALWLALVSGGITSGLGYVIWYRVLARIAPVTASIAQMSVPVIASILGLLMIGEPITLRWTIGAALVLGGIAISLVPQRMIGSSGS